MPITPEAARERAKKAAAARWAATPDRSAVRAQLQAALWAKWERQVDPEGVLDPETRARLAKEAQHAHLAKARLARQVKIAQAKAAQAPETTTPTTTPIPTSGAETP